MSENELNKEEIKIEDYVDVDYSERRGELLFTTIAGDTLFNLDAKLSAEYSDILEDPLHLAEAKLTILKEHMDVLNDMLPKFDYYGKIINPSDSAYYDRLYFVQIEHNSGYVFAFCEQEGLERLAGYLADKDQLGGLYTRDEVESYVSNGDESEEELDNKVSEEYTYIDCSPYTSADQWCFYTPVEYLHIETIK